MCDTHKGLVKSHGSLPSGFGGGARGNSCSTFSLNNLGLKITSAQGNEGSQAVGLDSELSIQRCHPALMERKSPSSLPSQPHVLGNTELRTLGVLIHKIPKSFGLFQLSWLYPNVSFCTLPWAQHPWGLISLLPVVPGHCNHV